MNISKSLGQDIRRQANNCLTFICVVSFLGLSFRAFTASITPSLYLNYHYPFKEPLEYLLADLVIFTIAMISAAISYRTNFFTQISRSFSNFYLTCFSLLKRIKPLIPTFIIVSYPLFLPGFVYYYWNSDPSVYRDLSLSLITTTSTLAVLWRPRFFRSNNLNTAFFLYYALCALSLSFINGRQSVLSLLICLFYLSIKSFSWPKNPLVFPAPLLFKTFLPVLILLSTIAVLVLRTFNRSLVSFEANSILIIDLINALSFSFSMHDSEVFLKHRKFL